MNINKKDTIKIIELDDERAIIAETDRFMLKVYDGSDIEGLLELYNDRYVTMFKCRGNKMPTEKIVKMALEGGKRMLKYKMDYWAIKMHENGDFAGYCGLLTLKDIREVELGFAILPEYRNQGIATQAAIESLNYGFSYLKLNKIIALCDQTNVVAPRVLDKVGMRFTENIIRNGRFYDQYMVTKEEFYAQLENINFEDDLLFG